MDGCRTCELTECRDAGKAPLWDCIYRSQFWDVVHSYNTALPGWLCLVARRHIAALDEITEDEAVELGQLIRRVSVALKEATGCTKTYVVQFAEAPGHMHVHVHVIPRKLDLPADRRGPDIFKYLGVPVEERLSETTMNEIATRIRDILLYLHQES